MQEDPRYVKRFDEFVAMLTIAIATMLFSVLLQSITVGH
jgi:hypothetical protein